MMKSASGALFESVESYIFNSNVLLARRTAIGVSCRFPFPDSSVEGVRCGCLYE
jgi:hypothetical protein